jgi:hypothetical protein
VFLAWNDAIKNTFMVRMLSITMEIQVVVQINTIMDAAKTTRIFWFCCVNLAVCLSIGMLTSSITSGHVVAGVYYESSVLN